VTDAKFNFSQMVPISDLHRKIGEISDKVNDTDVLVLKNNKPEFVIIAPEKYEILTEAFELMEQLDIYGTVQKRSKKAPLNAKQLIKKLEAMQNDSKD
jgi:prevent-host-death family protein